MIHVLPINDIKHHDEWHTTCECKPTIHIVNGEMIVIHNSWDLREAIEEAENILEDLHPI